MQTVKYLIVLLIGISLSSCMYIGVYNSASYSQENSFFIQNGIYVINSGINYYNDWDYPLFGLFTTHVQENIRHIYFTIGDIDKALDPNFVISSPLVRINLKNGEIIELNNIDLKEYRFFEVNGHNQSLDEIRQVETRKILSWRSANRDNSNILSYTVKTENNQIGQYGIAGEYLSNNISINNVNSIEVAFSTVLEGRTKYHNAIVNIEKVKPVYTVWPYIYWLAQQ